MSIVGPLIADARVLDLFAGSGALGLEALSRGASHATLVEINPASLAAIRTNEAALGAADRVTVVRQDVFRYLPRLTARQFDLAFADPPYGLGQAEQLAARFLAAPFAASLILTGIHSYLGLHVVERGVIFVVLSLALVLAACGGGDGGSGPGGSGVSLRLDADTVRPGALLRFFRSVHFARFGSGTWANWAWIIVSFAPTVLFVSGFILWWKRVIGKKRGAPSPVS